MKPPVSLAAVLVAAVLAVPPSSAQTLFEDLVLDTMRVEFYPDGLGSGSGSGLAVTAEGIRVEELDAKDMRYCIDGHDYPACSYGDLLQPYNLGNRDYEVTADEVDDYEAIVRLGLSDVETFQALSDILEANVTVDGVTGSAPRPVAFDVEGAEGDVNSTQLILAEVRLEMSFPNDREAPRHEIRLVNLALASEGVSYNVITWTIVNPETWKWVPAETTPQAAQAFLDHDDWTSNQASFEQSTQPSLLLVTESDSSTGGAGNAWLWWLVGLTAAAIAGVVILVLARRRG